MKLRLPHLFFLVLFSHHLWAQTSKPSVVNMMKQSELSASSTIRLAAEATPDYSTKKERPITLLEVPQNAQILKAEFAAPIGPKPLPPLDAPGIEQQSVSNFLGIADESTFRLQTGTSNRFIPPDVGGYIGPNHLVTVSNNQMRITTKAGVQLSKVDIEVFWQGTPGYGVAPGPFGAGDPHILYDEKADRWITVAQTAVAAGSSLLVGVSQTNDPTGNWNRYLFRTDDTDVTAFDYPQIGYTNDWVVISGNMFPIAGGNATNQQLYIFKKGDLYAAEPLTLDSNAQRIITSASVNGGWSAPVTPMDNSLAANTMYLVQPFFSSSGTSVVKISSLTGVIPAVSWNNESATFTPSPIGNFSFSGLGNAAPQKAEPRLLATNDGRFAQAIMRNGRIWAVHHVVPTGGASRTAIQWWQFNTDGTVVQNGRIDDADGKVFRTFPSLSVNAAEDMVVGYSIFSKGIFPSGAYAVRSACTPLNAIATESIFKEGVSNYFKNFGGTRARWGDYSYTSLDPVTGNFWTVQQVADQRVGGADDDCRWATWWAQVQPGISNAVNFATPVSGVNESDANTPGVCLSYKDVSIPIRAICKAIGAGTITVSTTGTAGVGDFELLTPTVNFAANDFEKMVTVRVFQDQIQEGQETIILNFTVAGAGVVKGVETVTHTITIEDLFVPNPVAAGPTIGTIGLAENIANNTQPFRGGYHDGRTQWLISTADLRTAGLSAGNMSSISLQVASKTSGTSIFAGFTLKVRNYNSTVLALGSFITGLTTVYGPASVETVLGANEFVFASPFFWDGTSSLLFEACFDNAATIGNDIVESNITTPTVTQVWARENDVVGCDIATSSFSGFTVSSATANLRPRTTVNLNAVGTTIATVLNTSAKTWLGPNANLYLYNAAGEIMARIQNLSTHDFGCTNVTIDRAGTSSVLFWDNNPAHAIATKTLHISPANPSGSSQVRVTLYYTKAEVEGWQTATGKSWANVQMVKTAQAISSYTPGLVPEADVVVAALTDNNPLGDNYTISATFNNGFSGLGAGVVLDPLPVSWLDVSGILQLGNAHITWATANEQHNARFDVETSRNGKDYNSIGQLPGKGNNSVRSQYAFIHLHPKAGNNYYRIKQIDKDGTHSYSKIVVLRVGENGQPRPVIFPVPSSHTISLHMGQPTNEKTNWEIVGADSKTMRRGVILAGMLSQNIDISKLANGTYFLRVQSASVKEVLRFVKQ